MATRPTRYTPAPSPRIERSRPVYLERELDRIKETLDTLVDAVEELQKQ